MQTLRQTHMPYCIMRLEDGRYIVLNRDYKPLGIHSTDWVDYASHPSAAHIKITAAKARKLDWDGREDIERIYLYNDGCVPTRDAVHMTAYLERLALLMELEIKPPL